MMDSSSTAKPRSQVNLIAGLAIALIFVGGLVLGTITLIITVVGVVATLVAWIYAVFIAARARQTGWLGMLGIGLVVGLALAIFSFTRATSFNDGVLAAAQFGVLSLAFVTLGYGVLGGSNLTERGTSAFFGGWALLSLVVGGTMVGGAIGTTIGAASVYITALGFRLYATAGMMALVAWIVGLIVAFRTQAWGWFAVVVLLPGIGAFMFGLFGPTRQDVLMAQENARQRKAVGLN